MANEQQHHSESSASPWSGESPKPEDESCPDSSGVADFVHGAVAAGIEGIGTAVGAVVGGPLGAVAGAMAGGALAARLRAPVARRQGDYLARLEPRLSRVEQAVSDEELGGFICATVSDALRTPNKEWAQAFINATVNFARGMGVTEVDTYLSLLRRMSPTHLVVLRFMRSSHPGVRLNQGDIVETLSREIAKEAPELRGRMDHLRLAVQDAIDWRLLPYERHSIGVLNPQETEMLSLHKPRLTALGRGLVGFVEEHGGEGEGG